MARPREKRATTNGACARPTFPFTAIVGQEEMKLALLLNVVAPGVGGVLVTGHRGTAKSTAVRALAELLPPVKSVRGCAYNCDPSDEPALCGDCRARVALGERLKPGGARVPVVELPLGATEDRVCGTIDLARALKDGVKAFEPGLLARANRGFLYIDEVNLLEDHLVDLLLDVAATGRNRVEREGVSAEHPSRFRLVGSCNPEEGELRPQLLDRFGLCAEVETVKDLDERVLIVERREAFESAPEAFVSEYEAAQSRLRRRVTRAASAYESVRVPRALLRTVAELCLRLGVDGHRGEITVARAARALAAFEGRGEVTGEDVRRVALVSLRHRLRRDPLEQGGGDTRVRRQLEALFGADEAKGSDSPGKGPDSPGEDSERRRSHQPSEPRGEGARTRAGEHEGVAGRGVGRGDARDSEGRARDSEGRALDAEGRGAGGGSELSVAADEVSLREEPTAPTTEDARRTRKVSHVARVRTGARSSTFTARGRYAGASAEPARGARSVALDATLRAAAPRLSADAASPSDVAVRLSTGAARVKDDGRGGLAAEDLRFKRFRGKAGTLFVFLLDASGSMAVNRISQAKGALAHLLRRSYVNRDRVALVAFSGRGAELLLAPSSSVTRARRLLEEVPVGGGSPLAAGLLRALEVARAAAESGARRVRLVVFTDGRANVPLGVEDESSTAAERRTRIAQEVRRLGASLCEARVGSLVIDTQGRFTSGGEGQALAEALGGRYLRLPQLITEASLAEVLYE